ncbi:hypothetical protein E2562_001532 [Oryza meyeriana var. granulata]|uniref:Uncharacterized protein n=1 Tax=Oryza meyeriana var. granulata TaxID=110450 RepID=A0A6G1DDV3_9ORYZ|nr:hypothetical protein E2562_001532 [Oryza meyeriana var. granulata]
MLCNEKTTRPWHPLHQSPIFDLGRLSQPDGNADEVVKLRQAMESWAIFLVIRKTGPSMGQCHLGGCTGPQNFGAPTYRLWAGYILAPRPSAATQRQRGEDQGSEAAEDIQASTRPPALR